MMDAFLGVKHTEVSWMMKVRMLSPTMGLCVDEGDVELRTRVQHQRKNRIQSVEFHLDKKTAGTFKAERHPPVSCSSPPCHWDAQILPLQSWWSRKTYLSPAGYVLRRCPSEENSKTFLLAVIHQCSSFVTMTSSTRLSSTSPR